MIKSVLLLICTFAFASATSFGGIASNMTIELPGTNAQIDVTADGDMYSASVTDTPRKLVLIKYDAAGIEQWRSSVNVSGECTVVKVGYVSDRVLVFGTTSGTFAQQTVLSGDPSAFIHSYFASNGSFIESHYRSSSGADVRMVDAVVLSNGFAFFLFSSTDISAGMPWYAGVRISITDFSSTSQVYYKSLTATNAAIYAIPYIRMTVDLVAQRLYFVDKTSTSAPFTTFGYSVHFLNGNELSTGTTSTVTTFPVQIIPRPSPSTGFMHLTGGSNGVNVLGTTFNLVSSFTLSGITTQFVSGILAYRVNPIVFMPGTTNFFVAGDNAVIGYYNVNGTLLYASPEFGSGTPYGMAWNAVTEKLVVVTGSTIHVIKFSDQQVSTTSNTLATSTSTSSHATTPSATSSSATSTETHSSNTVSSLTPTRVDEATTTSDVATSSDSQVSTKYTSTATSTTSAPTETPNDDDDDDADVDDGRNSAPKNAIQFAMQSLLIAGLLFLI